MLLESCNVPMTFLKKMFKGRGFFCISWNVGTFLKKRANIFRTNVDLATCADILRAAWPRGRFNSCRKVMPVREFDDDCRLGLALSYGFR